MELGAMEVCGIIRVNSLVERRNSLLLYLPFTHHMDWCRRGFQPLMMTGACHHDWVQVIRTTRLGSVYISLSVNLSLTGSVTCQQTGKKYR